jgi:hypothetical protein
LLWSSSQLLVVSQHDPCFAFPGLPATLTGGIIPPWQSSSCWEFLTAKGWRPWSLSCFWPSTYLPCWETCSSSSPFWLPPTATPPCMSSWETCQCLTYYFLLLGSVTFSHFLGFLIIIWYGFNTFY